MSDSKEFRPYAMTTISSCVPSSGLHQTCWLKASSPRWHQPKAAVGGIDQRLRPSGDIRQRFFGRIGEALFVCCQQQPEFWAHPRAGSRSAGLSHILRVVPHGIRWMRLAFREGIDGRDTDALLEQNGGRGGIRTHGSFWLRSISSRVP